MRTIERRRGIGGKAENPTYIQSGLHFMFDGIWNTGTDVHDGSVTTVWKDCVGNNDMTLVGTVEWEDNCLLATGNSSGSKTVNTRGVLPEMTYTGNDGGTFEFVFRLNTNHNYTPMINSGTNYESWVYSDGRFGFRFNGRLVTLSVGSVAVNTNYYIACTYNNSALYVYKNGVRVGSAYSGSGYSFTGAFKLIGIYNDSFRWTDGRIYAIRHYNRALTSDEIANNYRVDKLRFGL